MAKINKHFFFIDDSGSQDWETPYSRDFVVSPPPRISRNLNFWRRNYFILAGIHIDGDKLSELNPEINNLKKNVFGTKHVEIKSDWMRNPNKRKKHYLDKFDVSEKNLKKFTKNWYGFLSENPKTVQIQAFVLDKRFYKNQRNKSNPLQISTQVLFDRVEMHPSAKECLIIFDQMEDQIHTEKRKHGEILKISGKEIDLGSFHKKYTHAKPRFEKSSNNNFLQLADTVAYNVFRQFVDHGDIWEGKNASKLKMYPYFADISANFYNKNGCVGGIGIVKIPDPQKNRWGNYD